MNDGEILGRLREKIGLAMDRNADFEVLSQAVCDATGERLGVNTLKRLFGYSIDRVTPRRSTMDVIARYLGFADYASLLADMGEDADISAFSKIDCLEISELMVGARVRLAYEPNRRFLLTYLGNNRFAVEEVNGSRNIREGDELTITHLALGRRFVVAHVWRNGADLGPYEAAKFRGLTHIEVEE